MNSQVTTPNAAQAEKPDAAADPAEGERDRGDAAADSVADSAASATAGKTADAGAAGKAPSALAEGGGKDPDKAPRLHAIEGRGGAAARDGAEQGKAMKGAGQAGKAEPARVGAGAQQRREGDFAPAPGPRHNPGPGKPQPDKPQPQQPGKPQPQQVANNEPLPRPASAARVKTRHHAILGLAFLLIVLPGIVTGVYLWKYAVDQYVSEAGFAIRTESTPSPFEFLGGLMGGSSTTSKDMDILNSYLTSQQLVAKLDKDLNLKKMFSKPTNDPYFAFNPKGTTIEDLVNYWKRMVVVNYNNSTGLMQLSVHAFSPQDAQKIAKAVLDESSAMVNSMAEVAQADTTRYAKKAMDDAKQKLDKANKALTAFRVKHNIVDPTADLSKQNAVIGSLTQQLVSAQIQLATLQQGPAAASDPRVKTVQQRIDIIQNRIAEEQKKVAAADGSGSQGYAAMVVEYQGLVADQAFNEKTYMTAMATYDGAVASAQQKKVYLTTFEEPTLAQASTAPKRWLLLGAVMLIGFFVWAIITMVYYALRDRR